MNIASTLLLFFGLKTRTKDYGGAYPTPCANCDAEVLYRLIKLRTWFHIWWIPLIPWTARHQLRCPECGYGYRLSESEAQQARGLTTLMDRYEAGEVSQDEVNHELDELQASLESKSPTGPGATAGG